MANDILGDLVENMELEDAQADHQIQHEEPQVEQIEANQDATGSPIEGRKSLPTQESGADTNS